MSQSGLDRKDARTQLVVAFSYIGWIHAEESEEDVEYSLAEKVLVELEVLGDKGHVHQSHQADKDADHPGFEAHP